MRRWHQDKKSRARIEIIPMIDVMMFLLVFFVLISIDVIPAFGVKIHLPLSSNAEVSAERYNAVVSLGQGGELKLDGVDVTAEELVPRLIAVRQDHPQVSVIVNGDRTVELQRVIGVMDRIKAAGFQTMSIATRKVATQNPAAS
ncbi:MAG: biopolymer transporter ExbD [Gallionella sp.]|nr:biopolymer transporter ExbD [Gallionella sp.]